MFSPLAARLAVSVLLVSLQRMSVVLLPALRREVRKEGMVRVGVGLVVVTGWSGGGVHLMRMVMVELMLFVFALLVPLLAARPLLILRRRRNPFLARVLGALPASSPVVRLPAARAERVARGGP